MLLPKIGTFLMVDFWVLGIFNPQLFIADYFLKFLVHYFNNSMRKCIKKNIFVSELNVGNTRIEGLGVISPFFTSLLRTVRDEWRSARRRVDGGSLIGCFTLSCPQNLLLPS